MAILPDEDSKTLLRILQNLDSPISKAHLARLKGLTLIIRAMMEKKTLVFSELAQAIPSTIKKDSVMRRYVRALEMPGASEADKASALAQLGGARLAQEAPPGLDVLNWRIGSREYQVLQLFVCGGGRAVPLAHCLQDAPAKFAPEAAVRLLEAYKACGGATSTLICEARFTTEPWRARLAEAGFTLQNAEESESDVRDRFRAIEPYFAELRARGDNVTSGVFSGEHTLHNLLFVAAVAYLLQYFHVGAQLANNAPALQKKRRAGRPRKSGNT